MNNNSKSNCFYRWLRNRYSSFLSPDYSENEARFSSTWKNSWSCWKMLTLIISGIYKKYRCWSDPYVSCCQPAGPFPSQRVIDIFPSHQIMASVLFVKPLCWLFIFAGTSNLTQPSTGNQSQFTRWCLVQSFDIMTTTHHYHFQKR